MADISQFPQFIMDMPQVDLPIDGAEARLLQGENQQVLFMRFDQDAQIPEHSHEDQWGVVIAGEIELTVGGKTVTYSKGDSYFIPAGTRHKAHIKAGYQDITVFNQKDRYPVKQQH